MASDKERREVAATMRAISGRGVKDLTLGEVLNSILTGGAPRPTTEMAILANLADLIDRPTCEDVFVPRGDGFTPYVEFKCSACDCSHVSLTYVRYCPNCGAEVTDDD